MYAIRSYYARNPLQLKLHRADSQNLIDGDPGTLLADLRHTGIQRARPSGEIDRGRKDSKLPLPSYNFV